tara:strand:+ start:3541 stop:3747 length:207 start_codon:yes stop_codon:yes gene_type:complete
MNINKVIVESIFVGALFNIVYNQIPENIPLKVFVTAASIHIAMELFGINKWYCRNGAACTANTTQGVQ